MLIRRSVLVLSLCFPWVVSADPSVTGDEIVQRVLDTDSWGLNGAEVVAKATVKDKGGAVKVLAFSSRSRRHHGSLSKGIIRFSAPADLRGVGFLQIQNEGNDDDRFLFLPELKRSRRIAGNTRDQAFMGTDFNYADMDRKDLRHSVAVLKGEESYAKSACYRVEVTPKDPESPYGRTELWVRKDNFVPLKWLIYSKSGTLMKTLLSKEVRRIKGRWFITKSQMQNHQESRQTDVELEKVEPTEDIPDGEFTVRNLEKA